MATPAASARGRRNIGQVLEELRPDFPGVTIPKIRFLEDKGLIKPERTPAGYRKFSAADVERLRYILRMQRDHYLPLRVIGEHLDAIDRGLEPPPLDPVVPTVPTVALAADGTPSPESFGRRDRLRMSRRELLKVAEIDEELLGQLEQFGLLSPATGTRSSETMRYSFRSARNILPGCSRPLLTTVDWSISSTPASEARTTRPSSVTQYQAGTQPVAVQGRPDHRAVGERRHTRPARPRAPSGRSGRRRSRGGPEIYISGVCSPTPPGSSSAPRAAASGRPGAAVRPADRRRRPVWRAV